MHSSRSRATRSDKAREHRWRGHSPAGRHRHAPPRPSFSKHPFKAAAARKHPVGRRPCFAGHLTGPDGALWPRRDEDGGGGDRRAERIPVALPRGGDGRLRALATGGALGGSGMAETLEACIAPASIVLSPQCSSCDRWRYAAPINRPTSATCSAMAPAKPPERRSSCGGSWMPV